MTSEPSRSNYSLRKKGRAPQSKSDKSRTGGAATSHYPSVWVPAGSWDTRSQTARPLPEEIAEGKPLERLCSAPRSVIATQTERWSSLESLCLGFPCPEAPAPRTLHYLHSAIGVRVLPTSCGPGGKSILFGGSRATAAQKGAESNI